METVGARSPSVPTGSDVERMDDLLKVMIEFDDFDPGSDAVALDEKLQVVARYIIASECAMRQTRIQLTGHEKTCQMRADEAQLKCILKSMLLAV